MNQSQLDANTYGVGELITQRKLFAVPEHQRNYSWGKEQVAQLLDDIRDAFQKDAAEYFIGLIVLRGPIAGYWHILDGQQRLATTTMIYAGIREWLQARGFVDDARQIETEFIGVRQLGGTFTPRLHLNTENKSVFDEYVNSSSPKHEITEAARKYPKNSSSRNILDAALLARSWIEEFCNHSATSRDEQARALFSFASYLEKRVQVVCVDVTSEIDAFVLFEALNDRGLELSALDLVKNHIFSQITQASEWNVKAAWDSMSTRIEGQDADDFLKVFWTSRFGIIPKSTLFPKLRKAYAESEGTQQLAIELADAAEKLERIDDYEHPFWNDFPLSIQDYLRQLSLIGNKQVRPVILAALSKHNIQHLDQFLSILIVTLVRYQLIGRRRTGVLEKSLGSLAEKIWNGSIGTNAEVWKHISSIIPNDDDFKSSFCLHQERKGFRLIYLLMGLEAATKRPKDRKPEALSRFGSAIDSTIMVDWIAPPGSLKQSKEDDLSAEEAEKLIGNVILIERSKYQELKGKTPEFKISETYQASDFILTKKIVSEYGSDWNSESIVNRTNQLSELAIHAWPLQNFSDNA